MPALPDDVVHWLVGSESDPSVRWQALRDLSEAPEDVWSTERSKVEREGWGARLLATQDPDGQWAGGAYNPKGFDWDGPEGQPGAGQPWTATIHTLSLLRELGLDPESASARRSAERIGANSRWLATDTPHWEGEVEPCVNGRTIANGAYFGVDVSSIVDRLNSDRLEDGGWNCDTERGSVRSSFDTTINVLEGLLIFEEKTGGTQASVESRKAGEQYLLERQLFLRKTTGEPADPDYLVLRNPWHWQYDILRGLDYFRAAGELDGTGPHPALGLALEHLQSQRGSDGRWPLGKTPPGRMWFPFDEGPGIPSLLVTLRASRVLRWTEEAAL